MAMSGSGDTKSAPLVLYRWLGLGLRHQFCPSGALQVSLEALGLTPVWALQVDEVGFGDMGSGPTSGQGWVWGPVPIAALQVDEAGFGAAFRGRGGDVLSLCPTG